MAGSRPPIGQTVSELLGAISELVRAELAALAGDLRRDVRVVLRALAWALAAFALLFWAVALFAASAVLLLTRWLEPWLAAGSVGVAALLVGCFAALLARTRVRATRSPQAVVGDRWQAHRSWWDREMEAVMPGSASQGKKALSESDSASAREADIPLDRQL